MTFIEGMALLSQLVEALDANEEPGELFEQLAADLAEGGLDNEEISALIVTVLDMMSPLGAPWETIVDLVLSITVHRLVELARDPERKANRIARRHARRLRRADRQAKRRAARDA